MSGWLRTSNFVALSLTPDFEGDQSRTGGKLQERLYLCKQTCVALQATNRGASCPTVCLAVIAFLHEVTAASLTLARSYLSLRW